MIFIEIGETYLGGISEIFMTSLAAAFELPPAVVTNF
jgi:hypothetical protein